MQHQIQAITGHLANGKGMDIIIVSTSSPQQQAYWSERFQRLGKYVFKSDAIVLTILEDWPGGAGNGFGSLYAFQKAAELAKEKYGVNLVSALKQKKSIAMYHTAGYGQRLAPLTCSELNNKSAVKLPCTLGEQEDLLTILEAVIKQTAVFSDCNQGRLSIFWGDQLFIPENLPITSPQSHVEILAKFDLAPNEEKWKKEGLDSYGLITRSKSTQEKTFSFQAIDKMTFEEYSKFIKDKKVCCDEHLGISLGCPSLSLELLEELLAEFSEELSSKKNKMDIDPEFWFPATIDVDTYCYFMQKNGTDQQKALATHRRVQAFLARFQRKHNDLPFFAARDIGSKSYWWDYGTCLNYYQNNLKLLETSQEADAMKLFFGIKKAQKHSECDIDSQSILINCKIGHGKIRNSLLINVNASEVNMNQSLAINVTSPKVHAEKSLIYNAIDREQVSLKETEIRADLFILERHENISFFTTFQRNNKKDWQIRLTNNWCSYADATQINATTNQVQVRKETKNLKKAVQELLHAPHL